MWGQFLAARGPYSLYDEQGWGRSERMMCEGGGGVVEGGRGESTS